MRSRIRFFSWPGTGAWGLVPVLVATPVLAGPFDDPGIEPAAITAWADAVVELVRGSLDVASPELGVASFGDPALTLGPVNGDVYDVVSLGDGGAITLGFAEGIGDGPGVDFAVFENGFFAPGGLFGELAFVEVSSNGVDFARFESESVQAYPVEGYEPIEPTDYDGLAGRHPLGLGTGFDLATLATHPLVDTGRLDLATIQQVRVVDVVGDGSTRDAFDAPIFDPYPTAFAAGGFDLDAIGVVHPAPEPEALAALVAGLGGVVSFARRRRRGRRRERSEARFEAAGLAGSGG
ncbi:MAG: PEP-CTERM sorting domain-containing protein [Myxococcota bacterium]